MPKRNKMAYEQVELAGVPFSTFVVDRNAQDLPGNNSWFAWVCAHLAQMLWTPQC